ncbi:MAG: FAD:protein FMN transferase [Pirellulales bacterium]|jgi:thiamine biosynthesis lipoprotein|nr:FAD:protein FMN transferase [Thermoguttaceae bacterium]MDD4788258.1 FAD:protein FMN transferase [Pirellulales bacterium]MDI9444339.1 FAD:protein FMN transferase [Planctomycetota bacterium]NLZ01963.1 FAD:protein FMN transferase [Pirellulaceae bacterium]
MTRPSTRRDFLRGLSAAEALGEALEQDLPESRPGAKSAYAVHISRRAMACEFEIVLNAGQYGGGTETALDALDLVESLEAQLSYFRPESELARVNRQAGEQPVAVDRRLFELLECAQEVYRQTQGAFDPTATPLWKVWGFARRQGRLPDAEELAEARRNTGGSMVALDAERQTVRFSQSGVELSLGSIGKGYALDRAAELLDRAGIDDYLLQGGQSSVLARGARLMAAESAEAGGWTVGLGNPLRPGKRLGEVRLRNRALGTSGSAAQFFRHQGRRYSHLLDPRTGWPAEGLLSATVLAPRAATADALATALFVMGCEQALEFCGERPGLAAILVCPAATGPGIEIATAGLADDEFRLTADP